MSVSVSKTRLTWEECLWRLCRQRAVGAWRRYGINVFERLSLYYRNAVPDGPWGDLWVGRDDEVPAGCEAWHFLGFVPCNITLDQLVYWFRDKCKDIPILGAERLECLPASLRGGATP